MGTAKLTVRLPAEDLEFARAYARDHDMTVTEVIHRYLRRMRDLERYEPSPELAAITGLVPPDIDVEAEYRRHHIEKHR